ncbi:MaoC family dehydratase N-terminal domain-containing protein [Fodinicola feengrottensis]|uniref:MaoC family dehydratase N-terminal domain-containing protein n=1 Tax=Fodinicola feengrottensis TaxID=435914 RepID=A0ABN2GA90_9ACTN
MTDEVVGRTYESDRPYLVSAEKIAEFAAAMGDPNPAFGDSAAATKLGHPDVVAPPTFVTVISFGALNQVIADLGLRLHRLLHGDQRFVHHRPIVAGDRLVSRTSIESLRRISGAEIYTVKTEVSTVDGAAVTSATATLLHRPEESE